VKDVQKLLDNSEKLLLKWNNIQNLKFFRKL
jgi:hypothetical protein